MCAHFADDGVPLIGSHPFQQFGGKFRRDLAHQFAPPPQRRLIANVDGVLQGNQPQGLGRLSERGHGIEHFGRVRRRQSGQHGADRGVILVAVLVDQPCHLLRVLQVMHDRFP